MATAEAHVTCTFANHRPLAELSELIRKRAEVMNHELTESAVRATAINILTSLRAATSVAKKSNPAIIESRWVIDIRQTSYVAGWTNGGHRVIRASKDGHAIRVAENGNRIVNLAGDYSQGEQVNVYRLKISELPNTKPFYDVLVLAKNREGMQSFVEKRIRRRIGQYSGVSKRVLGIAMKRVGSRSCGENSNGEIGTLAGNMASVKTNGSGYSSGSFGISVASELPFSLLAVKGGAAGVDSAMKKAANRTAAIINRFAEKSFTENVDTPFPEVAKK